MGEEMRLGTDGTSIPVAAFAKTHSLWAGRSGAGKTHALFWFCLHVLHMVARFGWSLIVLDFKGGSELSTLADWVFQAARRIVRGPRVFYWNPHEHPGGGAPRVPGINVFQKIGRITSETLSEQVLENLEHTYPVGDGGDLFHPWIREWGRGVFTPLIEAGLTIVEGAHFASLTDPRFREVVLAEVDNAVLTAGWRELAALKSYEQATVLRAITSRVKEVSANPLLAAIVGQTTTTFDWTDVMDRGGVASLKLGSSPSFSETSSQFVGRATIDQLIAAGHARSGTRRRPCLVVIDEVERVSSPSLARALSVLRGHGVTFHLAVQFLTQLRDESPRLLESALTNCWLKFIFSVNRRDAELLAGEVWSDFGRDEILESFSTPIFAPRETQRMILSTGGSEGEGDVTAANWQRTRQRARAEGTHWQEVESTGTTINPDGDRIDFDGAASAMGGSRVAIEGEGEGVGGGRARVKNRSRVWNATVAPFTVFDREERVSGRRTAGVEQLKERAIGSLVDQAVQGVTMKYRAEPPARFSFVDVAPPRTPPGLLRGAIEEIYSTFRPVDEVLAEVRARVARYLESTGTKDGRSRIAYKTKRR